MQIGIIGGTGAQGRGMARRWAKAGHQVVLGSRSAERGQACAEGMDLPGVSGSDQAGAAAAEVVVLSIPYASHGSTIQSLAEHLAGKIVIDVTVPLKPPKVRTVHLPEGKAAALETQALLPDSRVAATLHHISATHLAEDHEIDCDILVCCNDKASREVVIGLVGDLGLRGFDAGRLANAVALEALTPVLIHMNKRYGSKGAGIRITGLDN